MEMTQIHESARRCVELHGNEAEAVARQKARECRESGNDADAKNWERVANAIGEMRASHHS